MRREIHKFSNKSELSVETFLINILTLARTICMYINRFLGVRWIRERGSEKESEMNFILKKFCSIFVVAYYM